MAWQRLKTWGRKLKQGAARAHQKDAIGGLVRGDLLGLAGSGAYSAGLCRDVDGVFNLATEAKCASGYILWKRMI